MKRMILLIIILIIINGCKPSIDNYKCKIGERIGDNCYTEVETTKWEGCGKIFEFYVISVEEFIYSNQDEAEYWHITPSRCVIEMLKMVNITSFWINDTSIEHYWKYGEYLLKNNDETNKTVCINVTYTYRWKRTIWNDNFISTCPELEGMNAEIMKTSFLSKIF